MKKWKLQIKVKKNKASKTTTTTKNNQATENKEEDSKEVPLVKPHRGEYSKKDEEVMPITEPKFKVGDNIALRTGESGIIEAYIPKYGQHFYEIRARQSNGKLMKTTHIYSEEVLEPFEF